MWLLNLRFSVSGLIRETPGGSSREMVEFLHDQPNKGGMMKIKELLKDFRTLFLGLVMAFSLTACGGGDDPPSLQPPDFDLSGTWIVKETILSATSVCVDEEGETSSYEITVKQEGNSLTVTTPAGTFSGTISGDKVQWSGSYPDDGGTTTIAGMELTASSKSKLGGNTEWTWTDGNFSCSGTTQVDADLKSGGTSGLPAAPTSLKAAALSSDSISLSWTDNADNETSYMVEGGLTASGSFFRIAALGPNNEAYIDDDLSPSTTYYYRVQAYRDGEGYSTFSNTASAKTQ